MFDFIFNIVDSIQQFIFNAISILPDFPFSVPIEVKNAFIDFIKLGCYIFPVRLCLPIITVSFAIMSARFILAIYNFIKSHIPFFN